MEYTSYYNSPLGKILLATDNEALTGLWFLGQKYFGKDLKKDSPEKETEIIKLAKRWLDIYFSKKEPNFEIPLKFIGTNFQKEVWQILREIPYGKTKSYGEIAREIAQKRGLKRMSAQAVGGAVGFNRISIIVPCHRVIGASGALTGYAGGIEKKLELLKLENISFEIN